MKSCLNCGRFGYAWYDKKREWPMCSISTDESFDLFEEDFIVDRSKVEPGGDCEWVPIGTPLQEPEGYIPEPVREPIRPVLSLRERLTLKRQGKLR